MVVTANCASEPHIEGQANSPSSPILVQRATINHKIGTATFTEHVVPTCSYRMGTEKMGFAVAVIGGLNSPYCLSYNSYDVIIIIIIIIIINNNYYYYY